MTSGYDLIIIGGGPAGMSAGISGASEGLCTLLIDSNAGLGGQAGSSTRIENYMGFPDGISGTKLTAHSAKQLERFSAEVCCPAKAVSIFRDGDMLQVGLDDETTRATKSVLLASGLSYHRLDAKGVSTYAGRGVYYGTPAHQLHEHKKTVCIIGGANSAGQAAIHMAQKLSCEVHMLVRKSNITDSMSAYLIERIEATPNITVHFGAVLTEALGDGELKSINYTQNGELHNLPVDTLCIFIGASPKTQWVKETVYRNELGFLCTDIHLGESWKCERLPFPYETSMPGVFAAGDVRTGSTKRVAAAAGEGAAAVGQIHQFLARLRDGGAYDMVVMQQ